MKVVCLYLCSKTCDKPSWTSNGRITTSFQDRVCCSRRCKKCDEIAWIWESYRQEGTFRSNLHLYNFWYFILNILSKVGGERLSFKFSFHLIFKKAQARFNESSQKLDLLRYSLEQRLNELPKNHPKSSIIIEELSLVSSPTLSPRQSVISTQNQYSTLSKPAALTGRIYGAFFVLLNGLKQVFNANFISLWMLFHCCSLPGQRHLELPSVCAPKKHR